MPFHLHLLLLMVSALIAHSFVRADERPREPAKAASFACDSSSNNKGYSVRLDRGSMESTESTDAPASFTGHFSLSLHKPDSPEDLSANFDDLPFSFSCPESGDCYLSEFPNGAASLRLASSAQHGDSVIKASLELWKDPYGLITGKLHLKLLQPANLSQQTVLFGPSLNCRSSAFHFDSPAR